MGVRRLKFCNNLFPELFWIGLWFFWDNGKVTTFKPPHILGSNGARSCWWSCLLQGTNLWIISKADFWFIIRNLCGYIEKYYTDMRLCVWFSSFSINDVLGGVIKHMTLGDYVKDNVPSLTRFMSLGGDSKEEYSVPSLAALSSAMRLLERWSKHLSQTNDIMLFRTWPGSLPSRVNHRYEFKINHGEWVTSVKPSLGPGIAERVWEAVRTTDENIDICHSVKTELRAALSSLLGVMSKLDWNTNPGIHNFRLFSRKMTYRKKIALPSMLHNRKKK